MNKAEIKKKYPILSLRITPKQIDYIRRESDEKGLSVADYVRAVLFPFEMSDGEK